MKEEELLQQIETAEQDYQEAKKKLAVAKKLLTEVESLVIEKKITRDRLKETLREYYDITPNNLVVEAREQEIEDFRQKYPDLVQEALDRDLKDDK